MECSSAKTEQEAERISSSTENSAGTIQSQQHGQKRKLSSEEKHSRKPIRKSEFKKLFSFFNDTKESDNHDHSKHNVIDLTKSIKANNQDENRGMVFSKPGNNETNFHCIRPPCIPTWKDNECFINKTFICCVEKMNSCETCSRNMFATNIRGKPIASMDWFHDYQSDLVHNPMLRSTSQRISTKFFSMLTKQELQLREISRNDVYEALMLRFRGYYIPQEQDCLDEILNRYGFDTIKQWCLWKNELDKKFIIENDSIRNNVLYCSGCGDKCFRFQSMKDHAYYQKCINNVCAFFHKEGNSFARIKR